VKNVKIEITQQQKTKGTLRTSWSLKNIVLFAGHIPFTRKQNRIA
jgi:hypothetical protein